MGQSTTIIYFGITGVLTLLNWTGAALKKWNLYFVTKPLVLAALILYFGINNGVRADRLPFLLGLVFSLLGDIFLIPKSKRWFATGLGAFFCALVMYVIGFSREPATLWATVISFTVAVGLIGLLSWLILHQTRQKTEYKSVRKAFLAYGIMLILMTVSAILCLFRPGWSRPAGVLVSLGGIFFLASDIILSFDRLDKRIPLGKFWIIVTYHLAQFMIVAGVLINA